MGAVPFRRIIHQGAIMLGLSVLLGFASLKKIHTDIPSPDSGSENRKPLPEVTIQEMQKLLNHGDVFCIDARSGAEYLQGHIQSAISIPADEYDRSLASHLELFASSKMVVVYCDGSGCDLSNLVAKKLMASGMDRVSIFTAGWSAWKNAGLMVEK